MYINITKEQAFKILRRNLKEGEVLFEHDDGWNAEIWGRGIIEKDNGEDVVISTERFTWKRGDDGGYNKNKILLKRVKLIK